MSVQIIISLAPPNTYQLLSDHCSSNGIPDLEWYAKVAYIILLDPATRLHGQAPDHEATATGELAATRLDLLHISSFWLHTRQMHRRGTVPGCWLSPLDGGRASPAAIMDSLGVPKLAFAHKHGKYRFNAMNWPHGPRPGTLAMLVINNEVASNST